MSAPTSATLPATWSAIVINWNGAADLPACLAAIEAQTWPTALAIVVDNASTDDSLAVLDGFADRPWLRVLRSPTNLGFAGGGNAGIAATTGELVVTLNPDVTLRPDWAARLRDTFAANPTLGAAGGKLLYPDGITIQHAGGWLDQPTLGSGHLGRGEPDQGQFDQPTEPDFLTGGALMLRRAAVDAVGGFDAGFYPAYYEDADLCRRLRLAGWRIRYVPAAVGLHRESSSIDNRGAAYHRLIHAARLRFAAKHLPLADLVGHFLPAEATRLSGALQYTDSPEANDLTGASVFPTALLGGLAHLGRTQPASAPPSAESPNSLAHVAPSSVTGAPPRATPSLTDRLAEVSRRWLVEERPFTSATPLLGPLIIWLRNRLIDAGPRWHVRQILAQQIEFNAAATRALADTAREATAARLEGQATTALLLEQLETLAAGQAALLARLADLEGRLAVLTDASPPPDGQLMPGSAGRPPV